MKLTNLKKITSVIMIGFAVLLGQAKWLTLKLTGTELDSKDNMSDSNKENMTVSEDSMSGGKTDMPGSSKEPSTGSIGSTTTAVTIILTNAV